ncbi:hypothetical protein HN873_066079 [Arachis hypogaea]
MEEALWGRTCHRSNKQRLDKCWNLLHVMRLKAGKDPCILLLPPPKAYCFYSAQSPSIVAAVSGGQRHRRRLVLSPSNPPSSPGSLPSSPSSPSSSSSQHQQAVAFHLRAVINTISSSSSSRGTQQSTPEAFHRPQNLIKRNEQLYSSENPPSGVSLPFILVQTRPHATVEVEILEDMQLVHFDFNR